MNVRFILRAAVAAAFTMTGLTSARPGDDAHAQAVDDIPTAELIPARTLALDAFIDSNSPAVWERVNGQLTLFLFTSAGWPFRHMGTQLQNIVELGSVHFENRPVHGVWMEAVIPDVDGTWYGYYHHEIPAQICREDEPRTLPRIGAARSEDFGQTWEDLGTILEAPDGWHDCASVNKYFVGGVGDFSVVLDHEAKDLYFFFSQYGDRERTQGVAVGRMLWANRDRPAGKIAVWWHGRTWVPTRRLPSDAQTMRFAYPAGVPIYRAVDGWHEDHDVDAFWGPSVHWNTHLEHYVMLLNHARDAEWRQEGIYVAFSKDLANPAAWSTPERLIAGGQWYPQVIGIEPGTGTDKVAGEIAYFFMGGRSQYFIRFTR